MSQTKYLPDVRQGHAGIFGRFFLKYVKHFLFKISTNAPQKMFFREFGTLIKRRQFVILEIFIGNLGPARLVLNNLGKRAQKVVVT
jgi:hypothetical protein